MKGSSLHFAAMIGTSSVLMFAFMYLNTYEFEHVRWSTTRLYMTLLMASTMSVVMLSFMLSMYKDTKKNMTIYVSSLVVFLGALYLVRSQTFIADQSWMRAMIPHHSIAILTSERASIEDVRARDLAKKIIETQKREIEEMEWLINDIKQNGKAKAESEASSRPVPPF